MTEPYAVFGHPISHSLSPRIHNLFAKQTGQSNMTYTAIDVPGQCFDQALTKFYQQGGKGLNCTVPLKELAFKRADHLSERARRCGAVNTLVFREDGQIDADNTDGIGLLRDLTHNLKIQINKQKLLILGAGGATRGILESLLTEQPEQIVIANRTVSKATKLAELFSDLGEVTGCGYDDLKAQRFDIVVNATAASLHGQLPPLPDTLLAEDACCYDLAYSVQPTPFVSWGNQYGAAVSTDGIGMLVEQAAEAFLIWRGIRPETMPLINDSRLKQG
ncbi:MAG TPA: shikimate dehydrogenase [Crenotrichaceae bacterium]|nr:shikimate dehydrogenase [Crenotrichaceae bacterium]